jgi:hypothetical protein
VNISHSEPTALRYSAFAMASEISVIDDACDKCNLCPTQAIIDSACFSGYLDVVKSRFLRRKTGFSGDS